MPADDPASSQHSRRILRLCWQITQKHYLRSEDAFFSNMRRHTHKSNTPGSVTDNNVGADQDISCAGPGECTFFKEVGVTKST